MADNHIRNGNKKDGDVQELLTVLDRMQTRPRVAEVEEALVNSGRPDLVRIDIHNVPKEKGFIPTATTDKLEDLLINPIDIDEYYDQLERTRVKVTEDEKDDEDQENTNDEETPDEEEDWFRAAPRPEKRQNVAVAFLRGVGMAIPGKGDSLYRVLGKVGFWVSLLAAMLAAVILVNDMRIAPQQNQVLLEELQALYNADTDARMPGTQIMASFKQLLERNKDVKGWVSFHAEGKDFLDVELPFVQGKDNSYYRTHDFDGNESRYGTLFMDAEDKIDGYNNSDSVLIIRGNNTADQKMLSGMNRLFGPVKYSSAAPELELTTLYRRDTYYVFATALFDHSGKDPYDPFDTDFANEQEFNKYVRNLCARSLFDYPVDVQYGDSLVLLVVPTGDASSALKDGMLVVAARRERYDYSDEETSTSLITKNGDALMPYSWYINHGRTPQPYTEIEDPEEPEEESTDSTTPEEPLFPEEDSTTDTTETTAPMEGYMDPHDHTLSTNPDTEDEEPTVTTEPTEATESTETTETTESTIYNGEQVTKYPTTETTA